MKSEFWNKYGTYFSFVGGVLTIQLIKYRRIDHLLETLLVIGVGFVIHAAILKLVEFIKK